MLGSHLWVGHFVAQNRALCVCLTVRGHKCSIWPEGLGTIKINLRSEAIKVVRRVRRSGVMRFKDRSLKEVFADHKVYRPESVA